MRWRHAFLSITRDAIQSRSEQAGVLHGNW